MASRWVGRDFGRVVQKSPAPPPAHHFHGASIQTLIADKGGPSWINSQPSPGVCKWCQECGILSLDSDWEDGRLARRRIGLIPA